MDSRRIRECDSETEEFRLNIEDLLAMDMDVSYRIYDGEYIEGQDEYRFGAVLYDVQIFDYNAYDELFRFIYEETCGMDMEFRSMFDN